MKWQIVFLLIYMVSVTVTKAQQRQMPEDMLHSYHEYSGMCLYDGKVFLLPQSKRIDADYSGYLHSLDTDKLWVDSNNQVHVPDDAFRKYRIRNFREAVKDIKKFGGFEAIVIADGVVFLSVETDDDPDYILKGHIHDSVIDIEAKRITLPKVKRGTTYLTNAGYEGMALYNGKLLVAFEYNYLGAATKLFLIDTSFNNSKVTTMSFQELAFRITDLAPYKRDTFLAINQYWNYNNNPNHREAYYKDIDPAKDADLRKWTWHDCFSRVAEVIMDRKSGTASWRTKMVIPNRGCINWEGIVPYKKGVLLISDDNSIKWIQTKLTYFPFPD
jgi:hypothetical protein